jgi:hypothetical protein
MIDRQHVKAKVAAAREPKPKPPPPPQPPGAIASGVDELVAELGANPSGVAWQERLESRFRHLLERRLQQARFRLERRPGKPLPRDRVEEIRGMVATFLAETRRHIDALAAPDIYRGSLGPWLEWIGGQFMHHDLGDLWTEIRPELPNEGLENMSQRG